MALTACAECAKEISDRAAACPHCGKARKRRTSTVTWFVGFFLVFILVGYLSGPDKKGPPGPQKTLAGAPRRPPPWPRQLPCDMVVASNNTFRLDEPYIGAKRLGTCDAGQVVWAKKMAGDWYYVSAGLLSINGWIHKDNLQIKK